MKLSKKKVKSFVIIGGGISGIVSALLLKNKNPNSKIYLFEASNYLGGNLNGFFYENDIYFDKGTHIFQETGDYEIDKIIQTSVEKKNLILFKQGKGDFIGSIYQNKYNENSHYPNIEENYNLKESVINHLTNSKKIDLKIDYSNNLKNELERRFGSKYAFSLNQIFKNIFKENIENLSSFYLRYTGLNRLLIGKNKKSSEFFSNEYYRNFIGFPNQFQIPNKFLHKRRSFYSKFNGTSDFVNGLIKKLVNSNISVNTSTRVKKIISGQKSLIIEKDSISEKIYYDKLLVTSGFFSALNILDYKKIPNKLNFIETTFFNVVLKEKSKSKVFYIYNFDSNINFYRLTNYRAFSGNDEDKRITIECHNLFQKNIKYLKKILKYLTDIGVLISSDIEKIFIENKKFGLPLISTENYYSIQEIKSNFVESIDNSILITGIGMGNSFNFFQNEILLDCKSKINNIK